MTTGAVLAAAVLLAALAAAAARREQAALRRLCRACSGAGARPVIVTWQTLSKRVGELYLFAWGHSRRVWNGLQCTAREGELLVFCMSADLGFGHSRQRRRWLVVTAELPMDAGRLLVPPDPFRPTPGYDAYVPCSDAAPVWYAPAHLDDPGAVGKVLAAVAQAGPQTGAELKGARLTLWRPYRRSPGQCEGLVRAGLDLCRCLQEQRTTAAGSADTAGETGRTSA